MQRILETPIQRDPAPSTPHQYHPYLRLQSELDEQGRSVYHQLDVRAKGNSGITAVLPHATLIREAEMAVDLVCTDESGETVRIEVNRATLAASGLRLALATSLIDTSPPSERFS